MPCVAVVNQPTAIRTAIEQPNRVRTVATPRSNRDTLSPPYYIQSESLARLLLASIPKPLGDVDLLLGKRVEAGVVHAGGEVEHQPLQVRLLSRLPEDQSHDPTLAESAERSRKGDIVVDFLHVIAIV